MKELEELIRTQAETINSQGNLLTLLQEQLTKANSKIDTHLQSHKNKAAVKLLIQQRTKLSDIVDKSYAKNVKWFSLDGVRSLKENGAPLFLQISKHFLRSSHPNAVKH